MERFSTTLDNSLITLVSRVDAVRFSFLVMNSISYLNLHTLEYSNLNNRSRTVLEVANDFVCTEEKCRKIYEPNRTLLYNLNLDIPARRENRLKDALPPCSYNSDSSIRHIAKIAMFCPFYIRNMSTLIEEALKVSVEKLKILRFLSQSPLLKEEILYYLPAHVMNNFISYFYPKITDYVLFKSFIQTLDFAEWVTTYEEPIILEYLLLYVRHYGRNLIKEGYSMCQLIDNCILYSLFLNIKPLLKYTDAPRFSSKTYEVYLSDISIMAPELTEEVLAKIERRVTPQRLYYMLQILYIYMESHLLCCAETGSEVLRLLWNSSPVPCVTLREVERAFQEDLAEEEIEDMYEFYCKSIDENHLFVEPRPLKHLCRTTIRRILKENFWIPEGVRLTDLPTSLQQFLNLERVIITEETGL